MEELELSPLEELTLLLLYAPSFSDTQPTGVPGKIHLAKELFLLWKHPLFSKRLHGVHFEPYKFGPWFEGINSGIDELVSRNAIGVRQSGNAQAISLTDYGKRISATLWKGLSPEEQAVLTDVKTNLNPLSTQALLNRIYDAYPEFAVASEWKGSGRRA
jgi:hypothetical protein